MSPSEPLLRFEFHGQDMLHVLEITHKYGMDRLQDRIVTRLMEESRQIQDFIDMVMASRVVDSTKLYEKAIEGLARATQVPDREQAKLLGFDVYFDVMSKREENRRR
ncbi:hypothetical protein CPB86DRAFT_786809 [Serendipita vermifera]|nr:hypothetical protein CPB86DRAFT_786809 [Serendipita vermifera]